MRKHILPILLVLLMVLLVGCSHTNELPKDTEISLSSVGEFSELKQDENLTDEPSISTTESTASSTKNEVVTEPTESQEKEDKKPTSSSVTNITRFDNALEGLPKRLEINEQELENTKKQFETAKVDVCKPFNQEEELQTKTARLNELNALLNVDKRENEIVGGEPDEGDEEPTPKKKDRER